MRIRSDGIQFTLFLGALSALPPLSIDMGLPGIPSIERTFVDASGRGALTLSLFLLGFSIAPLVCGPVADRFGRRPTLLGGLLLFSLAAAACAFAPTFDTLLAFRLLQGLAAGGCVVLPLAIVRDLFEGAMARTRLSQVAAVLGLAPMLAPVLGGWVMSFSDWRTIYLFQALVGVIILIASVIGFEETLASSNRRTLDPRALIGSYRTVLVNRKFVAFTLVYSFGFACMFSYISGSAGVLMGELNLSETSFSLVFALTSCGVLIGSLLSGRLSTREADSYAIVRYGLIIMTFAAATLFIAASVGVANAFLITPLVMLVIFCFGLTSPSTNHEAMTELGAVAGAASGVMRCVQMLLGSIASALVAFLEPFGAPSIIMSALMMGSVALAAGTYLFMASGARKAREAV